MKLRRPQNIRMPHYVRVVIIGVILVSSPGLMAQGSEAQGAPGYDPFLKSGHYTAGSSALDLVFDSVSGVTKLLSGTTTLSEINPPCRINKVTTAADGSCLVLEVVRVGTMIIRKRTRDGTGDEKPRTVISGSSVELILMLPVQNGFDVRTALGEVFRSKDPLPWFPEDVISAGKGGTQCVLMVGRQSAMTAPYQVTHREEKWDLIAQKRISPAEGL